jgi:hypothetical protein
MSHEEKTAEWSQLLRLSYSNQDESVESDDYIWLQTDICNRL